MPYTYQRYSNPARTEVNDENGWLATLTDGSRTVSVRGQQRTFMEQSPGIADTFTRTAVTGGWGNSPYGGRWFTIGGSPANYQTTGTEARVTAELRATAYRGLITNRHKNIDARVRMRATAAKGQGLHQGMVFSYTDSNNYYMASLSSAAGDVSDFFGRTANGGWGKASSGQMWGRSGGMPDDYSVADSYGKHTVNVVNSSLRSLMPASRDFDCKVKIATTDLAHGSSLLAGLLGRYQDANNYYYFRVRFSSAPASRPLFIGIQKYTAGVVSMLGVETAANINHQPNTFVWVRAVASGSTLKMKIWEYGTSEPTTWQLQASDTAIPAAGQVGMRSLAAAGNTTPLPVSFLYDSFTLKQLDTPSGTLQLTVQRRLSGATTTIGTVILTGQMYAQNNWYWLQTVMQNGLIKVRAWQHNTAGPTTWPLQVSDNSMPAGSLGLRAYCGSDTPTMPVDFYFDDYEVSGEWSSPPTITHDIWVRLLSQPFNGAVDEDWLAAHQTDNSPDILALSAQYVTYSPPVINADGLQIAGDANYSKLLPDGLRIEGGDFNDYLGIDWRYPSGTTNYADPTMLRSLDCVGFVRVVFGYRAGYPLALSASATALPRTSHNMGYNAPGTVLASTSTAPPNIAQLAIMPGDVVYFSSTTTGTAESSVEHVGIYMGRDTAGNYRFISSRRWINGPTFADTGGPSTLNGSGQYAQTLRLIRRL